MTGQCARAEVLAGAVALGEASDAERDEYRRHLAGCGRCVAALGGEREIERVMSVVAQARDAETWEPDLRGALVARYRQRAWQWRWGVSGAIAAIAVSVGIHAFLAAGIPNAPVAATPPVAISYNHMTIRLEHRAPVQQRRATPQTNPADRQIVVVHNVVTLQRTSPRLAVPHAAAPVVVAQRAPKAEAAPAAGIVVASAPTQRDETSIGALRTAPTAAPPAARAESLAMFPNVTTIHDVTPIGGETAIVPRPAPIAYEEGAEGTTAFEVSVDERGVPVKCTITKPSGYLVLDDAVCKAAMRAHYAPRTVNGRAVPGVYHDAFTFRNNE